MKKKGRKTFGETFLEHGICDSGWLNGVFCRGENISALLGCLGRQGIKSLQAPARHKHNWAWYMYSCGPSATKRTCFRPHPPLKTSGAADLSHVAIIVDTATQYWVTPSTLGELSTAANLNLNLNTYCSCLKKPSQPWREPSSFRGFLFGGWVFSVFLGRARL